MSFKFLLIDVGGKNIRKLLVAILICIIAMLCVSGVSAQEIDADSQTGDGSSLSAEPTYTLVYAILGILFTCILFYSSYIDPDE